MPAGPDDLGQFACENGRPEAGSSDPYGGDIDTDTPLDKTGSTPNLVIAPESANAAGGADKLRYGACAWQNMHDTGSIVNVVGFLRNGARQPPADSILTVTPNFSIPAGKKIYLVYRRVDGTPIGEFVDSNGSFAVTSSLQCKANSFVRMQTTDAAGNPEDWIPASNYLTLSASVPLGLQRAGDTMLTAEFMIGWHPTKNEGQAPANRTEAPSGVSFTDGVRMGGYDQGIPFPEDGIMSPGDWGQLFLLGTWFAGAEPPLGNGQRRPNFRIGGDAE